ncbi:MAG: hypothetical protein ACE5Q6_17295 [Dehalococcoidia bacterium]
MSKILRFTFYVEPDPEDIEADLALAIFAAECLHGRPRVRLETRYLVAPDGQSCVMEVSGPAGESAAQVFAGLASARFGEEAVSVSQHQEQPLEVTHHGA